MRLSLSMLFRPLASCLNPCKGSIFRVQRACVSNLRKTTDHTPDMLKSQGAVRGLKPLAALQSPPQRNVPAASVSARQLSLKAYDSCRRLVVHQYTAFHCDWISAMDSIEQIVMPKERGDVRDAALMTFSVALFCVLGAQMYGIYMHLYFAAGLKPILQR